MVSTHHALLSLAPIGKGLALTKHISIAVTESAQMCHVEMSVNLREAPVLVSEMTPLAIEAELFSVKRPTILTLILVVQALFRLAIVHHLHGIGLSRNFIKAMGVLALDPIPAEASLCPVLAHLTHLK